MHEVLHPRIKLNVGVLELIICNLALGNPALNPEFIAILISERHFRCHEEAETWIFCKVLTEFVWDIVCSTSLWFMSNRSPSKFDKRVVHKVSQLLQIIEEHTAILINFAVFLEDGPDSTLVVVIVLPSCDLKDFNCVFCSNGILQFIEFVTNNILRRCLQLFDLFFSKIIEHGRLYRLQEVEILLE